MRGVIVGVVVILFFLTIEAADPTSRNITSWPFANYSIWNLPIGGNAVYVDINIWPSGESLWIDEEHLFFYPGATPVNVKKNGWSHSRCTPTSPDTVFTGPLPDGYLISSTSPEENNPASILQPDGNSLTSALALTRCTNISYWTVTSWMHGEHLDGEGIYGTRGGSGLSTLGGAIRLGELVNGVKMRHALQIILQSSSYYKKWPCYRWPAFTCDGNYWTQYGGSNSALKPGALVAIPQSVNISALKIYTPMGQALAWTLQNYGAYVVDQSTANRLIFAAERGVEEDWYDTYGYSIWYNHGGGYYDWVWKRDMDNITLALAVVDNWNYYEYIRVRAADGLEGAGGGTPLQPWAPPFDAPTPGPPPPPTPVSDFTVFNAGVYYGGWGIVVPNPPVFTASLDSVVVYDDSTYSQKVTFSAAGKFLRFRTLSTNGVTVNAGYNYLHFVLRTGSAIDKEIALCTTLAVGADTPAIKISKYNAGPPTNTTWTSYDMPLKLFNLNPANEIQNFWLFECGGVAGATYYIDEVQFRSAPVNPYY